MYIYITGCAQRQDILAEAVGSNTTAAKVGGSAELSSVWYTISALWQIGESLSNALGGEISNLTASALGDKLGGAPSILTQC